MKVGDYVRTKNLGGSIEKIIEVIPKEKTPNLIEIYATDVSAKYSVTISENEIIKSSPNIIDLIEVGDYVNGQKVTNINGILYVKNIGALEEINIKSIVTKEQFEAMEYKCE